MSREIKFRALIKADTGRHWEYYEPLSFPAWIDIGKVIVDNLQFTGLLDKNGVEIYAGELLSVSHPDITHEFTGVVEYDNEQAAYVLNHNGQTFLLSDCDEFESLGNICEHKHLLGT